MVGLANNKIIPEALWRRKSGVHGTTQVEENCLSVTNPMSKLSRRVSAAANE
jgi:hypothetical protein